MVKKELTVGQITGVHFGQFSVDAAIHQNKNVKMRIEF